MQAEKKPTEQATPQSLTESSLAREVSEKVRRLGDEPSRDAIAETVFSVASGADFGAVGARNDGLDRLSQL